MKIKEIGEKMINVHASNTKEERATFHKYACKVPDNGTIVDIGTAAGGSAFVFVFASEPSVTVYTIDINKNAGFVYNVEEFGLSDKLIFCEQTSEAFAKDFKGKIDLLFVDGIHSYEGVLDDFNWYKDHMAKDGIIMFHDYYLYPDTVGKAIDEIIASGEAEKVEIVDSLYKGEVRTGLFVSRIIK